MPPQSSAPSVRAPRETLPVWALCATIVLALIIYIPSAATPLGPTKAYLLAAGALVALALYILARLSRGNIVFPPTVFVLALWLPALAYALSALFSGVSFASSFWGTSLEADTLGFILVATVLGTLAALALRRSEHYRLFFMALAGGFAAVVVIQTLVIIAAQMNANIDGTFSIIGTSTDLAIFLGAGVAAILLALRSLELAGRVRIAAIVLGVLSLALLAILGSSVAWVLVALVALGLFVEAVMKRGPAAGENDFDASAFAEEPSMSPAAPTRAIAAPLVVLAVALFFLIGSNLGNALATSLHAGVLTVRPSWQATLSIARQTYATSPLFGTGPSTFGADWLKYRDASLNSTVFWNVAFGSGIGFIPTSLITTGLLGAVAWIVFLALFALLGLRVLILRAPSEGPRFYTLLSFVLALFFFVAEIFTVPGPVLIVLSFVLAGVFASTARFAAGSTGSRGIIFAKSPRLGFVIVFALTLLLLALVAAAYTLVEHYVAGSELSQASTALSNGDYAAADSAAASSINFSPSAAAYQLAALSARAQLANIVASTTMAAAAAQTAFQTALSNGISAALSATQLDPNDYQNWVALGNLYAAAVPLKVSGAYDSAKAAYQKAAALDPTDPQIPYVVSQLDIADGNLKGAEADLQAAIALKQDYVDAIFLLSQVEVQDGDVAAALASAESAAYFTPTDPNVLFQLGLLRAATGDTTGAIAALQGAVTANPQFANARYFLAAAYAKEKDYADALTQLEAVAALTPDNASAVASLETSLKAGKDPFPANLLSATSTPVKQ